MLALTQNYEDLELWGTKALANHLICGINTLILISK